MKEEGDGKRGGEGGGGGAEIKASYSPATSGSPRVSTLKSINLLAAASTLE